MEEKIKDKIKIIIREGNTDNLTIKSIREILEREFGCDLKEKRHFIKETTLNAINEQSNETNSLSSAAETKSEPKNDNESETEDTDNRTRLRRRTPAQQKKEKRSTDVKTRKNSHSMLTVSPALAMFLDVDYTTYKTNRGDVVKFLWNYIKENNLQDPKDRRMVICDETLSELFKVKRVSMFKMQKYLAQHLKRLDQIL
eukprot:GCRY01003111.1.p1 GENE.GCRY01003111.1~~GCRY01003111.1.p1  ORF type:complete len:199 (-),score=23.53 GCRY01003111.1:111-707(-)